MGKPTKLILISTAAIALGVGVFLAVAGQQPISSDLKDVGFDAKTIAEIDLGERAKVILLSSFECTDCDATRELIVYHLPSERKERLPLPGKYTALDTGKTDFVVRGFYGDCGPQGMQVVILSQSEDSGIQRHKSDWILLTPNGQKPFQLSVSKEELELKGRELMQLKHCKELVGEDQRYI